MPTDPAQDNDAPTLEPPETEEGWPEPARSVFPHPDWTVGLVLVFAAVTLLYGLLVSPIWLVVGSPFLIVLLLWIWVKVVVRVRTKRGGP